MGNRFADIPKLPSRCARKALANFLRCIGVLRSGITVAPVWVGTDADFFPAAVSAGLSMPLRAQRRGTQISGFLNELGHLT